MRGGRRGSRPLPGSSCSEADGSGLLVQEALHLAALLLGRPAGAGIAQGRRAPHEALERVGGRPRRALVLVEGGGLGFGRRLVLQLLDHDDPRPVPLLDLDPIADRQVSVGLDLGAVDLDPPQLAGVLRLAPGLEQPGDLEPLVEADVHGPSVHFPAMRVPPEEFEVLVSQALDGLPDEFAELLENVVVVVEDEPDPEDLEALGMDPEEDELFGLYQGVPLAERDIMYTSLPDRVVIYRGPILRGCDNRRQVVREVRDTVIHELGHHFGLDEDDMPY